MVAIYTADGAVVKAYTLADLFTEAEIAAFAHSISSIDWRDGAYINLDQKTLYVRINSGASMVFGLETGKFAYCETRAGKFRCRDTNADRVWRPGNESTLKK